MRVEKLLSRLRREFIKVNLLQAALDSLLFFLSVNLGLFLFSLTVTKSYTNLEVLAALSFVVFAGDLVYRTRKYRLEVYEEKNPELKEILRTARDNLGSSNIVSQAMFDELMDRSRSVTSESIIPSTRIIQKILVVGVLSFLTVSSGLADFQVIQDGGEILPGVEEIKNRITGEGDEEFELRNGTEIYGNEREVDTSGRLIDFNITGEGETSDSELGSQREPEDVVLDTSGPAISEDLELAKKYSIAIKQYQN